MRTLRRFAVVSTLGAAMLFAQSGPSLPHDPAPNIPWWLMPAYVFSRVTQEIYGALTGNK